MAVYKRWIEVLPVVSIKRCKAKGCRSIATHFCCVDMDMHNPKTDTKRRIVQRKFRCAWHTAAFAKRHKIQV